MELREADVGSAQDCALRYIVITASGIALYIATRDLIMLVWLASYLCINTIYALALYRTKPPVIRSKYIALLLGNFVSSGLFASMPIYLIAVRAEPALHALALAGMVGHALFNLSRHKTRSPVAYWDMFCITSYCLLSGLLQISQTDKIAEIVVFTVAALAVSGYYVSAQLNTIHMHQRVEAAQVAAAHDQKINAIGRLTGGVAHDFNNLLTVVKGNLELYREIDDPSEKQEVIDEAHSAAQRAGEVIAQLLSFSRQSRLAPEPTDIETWAREFELLSTRLLPETVQSNFQVEKAIGKAYVDAGQLSAAAMNMVINARDAIAGAPGELHVSISAPFGSFTTLAGVLDYDQYLKIAVADTGVGIDDATLARVTEPFFTTKEVGHGSGLGLSMARGFAEQSGGGLQVTSVLGKGTEVTLYIKRSPVPHGFDELLAPLSQRNVSAK
ncbi:MAG: ATP-binding protein [Pseudomonadota bacterium]